MAPTTLTQPSAVAPGKFEAELTQMDSGVQSALPAASSLTLNGTAQKASAIDSQLQGYIATFKAVDTAKSAYQAAVKARLAITVEARDYYKALKAAITSFFGAQSGQLAAFGISPAKASTTTAKTKMVAAAKRAQTRALRGTKGKKEAAAITVVGQPPVSIGSDGNVATGAPPINVPAPSSSSTASAPASTPASVPATTPSPVSASSGTNGTPNSGSGTPASS